MAGSGLDDENLCLFKDTERLSIGCSTSVTPNGWAKLVGVRQFFSKFANIWNVHSYDFYFRNMLEKNGKWPFNFLIFDTYLVDYSYLSGNLQYEGNREWILKKKSTFSITTEPGVGWRTFRSGWMKISPCKVSFLSFRKRTMSIAQRKGIRLDHSIFCYFKPYKLNYYYFLNFESMKLI